MTNASTIADRLNGEVSLLELDDITGGVTALDVAISLLPGGTALATAASAGFGAYRAAYEFAWDHA
jgi:hypothetical protein